MLVNYYKRDAVPFAQTRDETLAFAAEIAPMVADVAGLLHQARVRGESMLFEGAQGALLDIDHGTYPYVTSSQLHRGRGGARQRDRAADLDYVLGIVKAYATRVGTGPFPTELTDDVGAGLAKRGNEFGSVTGRPRRCGWLDLAALKRSLQLNGVDGLCITKLDVLDGMAEIRIATSYSMDGSFGRPHSDRRGGRGPLRRRLRNVAGMAGVHVRCQIRSTRCPTTRVHTCGVSKR